MPELRRDPLTDRLVIIAPERSSRPHTAATSPTRSDDAVGDCPFCPGNEALTPPEVARLGDGMPDTPGWLVRVAPNKYPIVGGPDAEPGTTGAHEVVVLSPAHDRSFGRLDRDQAVAVLGMLRDRSIHHLDAGRAFVQVMINHGAAAGASLAHPHAQLVALDIVPPAVTEAVTHLDDAGTDLVATEIAHGGDLLVIAGAATAWCPNASASPYELRVAHRSTRARFEDATDAEIAVVADTLRDSLARIATVLGDVAYNLVVHTAPPGRPGHFHWYVQITPRVAVVAGFEMGTEIFVNTVGPERAAATLREVSGT